MIGAEDILVLFILKSECAQFQPSRILQFKRGFIAYLRWTVSPDKTKHIATVVKIKIPKLEIFLNT